MTITNMRGVTPIHLILASMVWSSSAHAQDPFDTLLNAVDTLQGVLEKQPDGGERTIGDPNSDTDQKLTILKTYIAPDGAPCREYKREILVQNPVVVYGRACRHVQGAWIIEQESLNQQLAERKQEQAWTPPKPSSPASPAIQKPVAQAPETDNGDHDRLLGIKKVLDAYKPTLPGSSFCDNPYNFIGKRVAVGLVYAMALGKNEYAFSCSKGFGGTPLVVKDNDSVFSGGGLVPSKYIVIGEVVNSKKYDLPDGSRRELVVIKSKDSFYCNPTYGSNKPACYELNDAAKM